MEQWLIQNARIVNEGTITEGDVWIRAGRIEKIGGTPQPKGRVKELDAQGRYLLPGLIDDQVHFREPGLTHKAEIYTEARAAVAGGVTSYMEMPNTKPPALTQERLEAKYARAAKVSLANYSFFMGAGMDNIEAVTRTDPQRVCGLKIFMGSSTGNLLVDDEKALNQLFARSPVLIATHCEDESTIRNNLATWQQKHGDKIPAKAHPEIRNVEGCLKSSTLAVELARKHGSRLHILHLTTADELSLFRNDIPLEEKRITAEVCAHHLYFDNRDYEALGNRIKCNPAIKEQKHREALWEALLDDRLDVIATDHAPHTREEKAKPYLQAPAGIPLVQHGLNIMLEAREVGRISLERIVEKMCHMPAVCFKVQERGFIREGYYADLCLLDPEAAWTVTPENIYYKCGWSPFEGHPFKGRVTHTFVNGHLAWDNGTFHEARKGKRLLFEREKG